MFSLTDDVRVLYYYFLQSQVFRCWQKVESNDRDVVIFYSRVFQAWGPDYTYIHHQHHHDSDKINVV